MSDDFAKKQLPEEPSKNHREVSEQEKRASDGLRSNGGKPGRSEAFESDDQGTQSQRPNFVVRQILENTHIVVEKFEKEPPSKRFLIAFVGIIGIVFLITSLFFVINSFLSPARQTKEELELSNAFVGLKHTLKANNPAINKELLAIIKSGGSSTQLADKELSEALDLGATLRQEFRLIGWDSNLPALRQFIARKAWFVGFTEIKAELPLLKLCDEKRKAIRAQLDKPSVDMRPTYELNDNGFSLKPENLNNLWGYVHLEEYEIGRALIDMSLQQIGDASVPKETPKANMKEALSALFYIFKAAEIASHQRDLNLRLHASFIRENALDTLQMLVGYQEFTRENANQVLNFLQHQLRIWDPDTLSLAGERTAGVWLYEVARSGNLLKSISTQDVTALQKLGALSSVENDIRRKIDADELYYLQNMATILQMSKEVYYLRAKNVMAIEDELEALRDHKEYPIMAGAILLRDLRRAMRLMATDRLRCEIWVVALAASLGQTPREITVDPLFGKPYQVQSQDDVANRWERMIVVRSDESIPPLEIPLFSAQKEKRSAENVATPSKEDK